MTVQAVHKEQEVREAQIIQVKMGPPILLRVVILETAVTGAMKTPEVIIPTKVTMGTMVLLVIVAKTVEAAQMATVATVATVATLATLEEIVATLEEIVATMEATMEATVTMEEIMAIITGITVTQAITMAKMKAKEGTEVAQVLEEPTVGHFLYLHHNLPQAQAQAQQ